MTDNCDLHWNMRCPLDLASSCAAVSASIQHTKQSAGMLRCPGSPAPAMFELARSGGGVALGANAELPLFMRAPGVRNINVQASHT